MRDKRLDFIKGTAAFLVLWGHMVQYGITESSFYEDPMYKLIYAFHMPVFIAISGYLFCKSFYRYSFTALLKKKITGILYPGIVWGGIQELFIAVKAYPSVKKPSAIILGIFTDIWFMWTLFCISVTVALCMKISRGRLFVLLPMLAVGGAALYYIPNCEGNLFMYPFFLTGMFYRMFQEKFSVPDKIKNIFGISNVIAFILLLYGYTERSLISVGGLFVSGRGTIPNDMYRYLTGGVGVTAFVYLCTVLFACMKEDSMIVNGFVRTAEYSGELYCVQCIIVAEIGGSLIRKLSASIGFNPLTCNSFVFDVLAAPAMALFFVILFVVFMDKFRKNRELYPLLFGW